MGKEKCPYEQFNVFSGNDVKDFFFLYKILSSESSGEDLFLKKGNELNLTFAGPCIANTFAEYNQQDATILNLFISVRSFTYFRQFFRPSSGAQNCTYSVRQMPDAVCAVLSF